MDLSRRNSILFTVSFAILFIELLLIRWVSTEIRIFAYLQNFVLLACFLGIGIGCTRSRRPCRLWVSPLCLAALVLCVTLPLVVHKNDIPLHVFKSIPTFLAAFNDTVIHYQHTIYDLRIMQGVGILLTMFVFFLVMMSLYPLGQLMGRVFDEHPDTVTAYSVNVAASLIGVWAYSGLSFIYTPPWVWFVVSLGLVLSVALLVKKIDKLNVLMIVVALVAVAYLFVSNADRKKNGLIVWSPYQKLNLRPLEPYPANFRPFEVPSPIGYQVDVNGVSFMFMMNQTQLFRDIYPEYFVKHPLYMWEIPGPENPWNMPYNIKKDARSVLILGGGAGDDAAAALRNGMQEIDVVEIDPGIVDLGRRFHPEKVYTNPLVNVIVDDARTFMNRSRKTYDLVHFGLLDSHSQSSTLNNMRMDHYVYTLESFREARRLLKEDGLFLVSFYVQRIWIGQRIQQLIKETFGWDPIVVALADKSGKGKVLMVSGHDRDATLRMIFNSVVFEKIKANSLDYSGAVENIKTTTDDWPYMYLTHPLIPTMHLIMIGVLIALFFLGRGLFLHKGEKINWHFFFLGGAFLLLEFQNINKTALLFGSTWLVNSINISTILFLILLANITAAKIKIQSVKWPYTALFGFLVFIYMVPLSVYSGLGFWTKAVLVSVILNIPIYFAGLIFITSFKRTDNRHLAMGSNLMGAAAGGLLEYLSFLLGIRALVLVTIALYALSLFFVRKVLQK